VNVTVKRLSQIVLAISIIIFYAGALIALAQGETTTQKPMTNTQPTPAPTSDTRAANPADVSSIEAILAAVYDVISGPAGKQRDWDRMRSLFLPGARLISTSALRRSEEVVWPLNFRTPLGVQYL